MLLSLILSAWNIYILYVFISHIAVRIKLIFLSRILTYPELGYLLNGLLLFLYLFYAERDSYKTKWRDVFRFLSQYFSFCHEVCFIDWQDMWYFIIEFSFLTFSCISQENFERILKIIGNFIFNLVLTVNFKSNFSRINFKVFYSLLSFFIVKSNMSFYLNGAFKIITHFKYFEKLSI